MTDPHHTDQTTNYLDATAVARKSDFFVAKKPSNHNVLEDSWCDVGMTSCLFIDLNHSSRWATRLPQTDYAQLLDYFTGSIVDLMEYEDFQADTIDVKGDGVYGAYLGENTCARAWNTANAFKKFFDTHVAKKFSRKNFPCSCKILIATGPMIMRTIFSGNKVNELWAGSVFTSVSSMAKLVGSEIDQTEPSIILLDDHTHVSLNNLSDNHQSHDTTKHEPIFSNNIWYSL